MKLWSQLDVRGGLAEPPQTMKLNIKSLLIVSVAAVALVGCSGSDQGAGAGSTNTAAASMPAAGGAAPGADAFLTDNAKKPGVVTLPDGLEYTVIKSGTGDSPKATDSVSVSYTGTLTDGTVFDSSSAHGGAATFGVGQVIPGWTEALQKMKVGDKWKLFIPANLAYGPQSPSPQIPPNSDLIFDVELLSINK